MIFNDEDENEYYDEDQEVQPQPIQRQMAYVGSMEARLYITNLRNFNERYGYSEKNNNIPLPEDVPNNITIEQYYAQRQQ